MSEVMGRPVDLDQVVSQEAFGELVGVSQQAVSDLLGRGVIEAGQPCGVWLQAYCRHLREQAAGRGADGELAMERARLAREQADAQAMKNRQARKELAPVVVLEEVLAHVCRQIGTTLEGISPQMRRRFPWMTAEQHGLVKTEIAKARQLAAAATLNMVELDRAATGEDEEA